MDATCVAARSTTLSCPKTVPSGGKPASRWSPHRGGRCALKTWADVALAQSTSRQHLTLPSVRGRSTMAADVSAFAKGNHRAPMSRHATIFKFDPEALEIALVLAVRPLQSIADAIFERHGRREPHHALSWDGQALAGTAGPGFPITRPTTWAQRVLRRRVSRGSPAASGDLQPSSTTRPAWLRPHSLLSTRAPRLAFRSASSRRSAARRTDPASSRLPRSTRSKNSKKGDQVWRES